MADLGDTVKDGLFSDHSPVMMSKTSVATRNQQVKGCETLCMLNCWYAMVHFFYKHGLCNLTENGWRLLERCVCMCMPWH